MEIYASNTSIRLRAKFSRLEDSKIKSVIIGGEDVHDSSLVNNEHEYMIYG